jgi:hypothetical protein
VDGGGGGGAAWVVGGVAQSKLAFLNLGHRPGRPDARTPAETSRMTSRHSRGKCGSGGGWGVV